MRRHRLLSVPNRKWSSSSGSSSNSTAATTPCRRWRPRSNSLSSPLHPTAPQPLQGPTAAPLPVAAAARSPSASPSPPPGRPRGELLARSAPGAQPVPRPGAPVAPDAPRRGHGQHGCGYGPRDAGGAAPGAERRQRRRRDGGLRTLVTVAHRLRTIADYDVVVVLGGGRLLELGSPKKLMAERGTFYDMVRHSGEAAELTALIDGATTSA